ncbi:MAG: PhnD/SsuA/transferrin family substrate-binding protein [Candidatus Thiodiazotropha endolucinida]|uniref:Phosphate/phosphite/phosphonate ABC transporter substrate-binding protein n=1 Tax=Candidatus Thiodiazotropha taylori TaxID=2792791 RepID=A0A9E4NIA7_9GAMM|nr:phosphate/phosphite/phosphonate ABC transporter substrate-binding protein [Candidatus Thiodiazotropha taylori]MBT3040328.1 phosphate/phosphite/phosphonate ABC transporter substrate-binding protein [Candidatus Thiodiazotropha sp. (ex Codakia orbicularis)]MCG7864105.1 phosphate/phosphite/phosphonate ABC transporter substrate-binding protein [Candidatus Thiodiazotropha endolucinida]MBT3055145.1 phosphate/phosphite/phosphonate ABC transporter substrate-binding protein [Candidatus Thiodiazotropha 
MITSSVNRPIINILQQGFVIGLNLALLFGHESCLADPYDRDTAYIGIMSRLMFSTDLNDTRIATELVFTEFMKNIGKKGEFFDFDSPNDVIKAMQQHRLDAVLTDTLDYLKIDHMVNQNHRYSVVFGPRKLQKIVLLTRRSDKISSLEQLRQKRLTHPSGINLGLLFLDVALMKERLPIAKRFFSTSTPVGDVNTAIIDLFFNKADAALVTDYSFDTASELNTQIANHLEVLVASEPIVPMVIGINKFVPSEFTEKVDEMAARLHELPKTLHLLSLFKGKGIVKISNQDLRSARVLKEEYEKLINSDQTE